MKEEACWNCGNPIWEHTMRCVCCGFEAWLWPERLARIAAHEPSAPALEARRVDFSGRPRRDAPGREPSPGTARPRWPQTPSGL